MGYNPWASDTDAPAAGPSKDASFNPWSDSAAPVKQESHPLADLDTLHSVVSSFAAPAFGMGEAIMTKPSIKNWLSGKDTFQGMMDDLTKHAGEATERMSHEPETETAKLRMDQINKGLEWMGQQGQAAAGNVVRAIPGVGEDLYKKFWPAIDTAGEQAGQAAPFVAAGELGGLPGRMRASQLAKEGRIMQDRANAPQPAPVPAPHEAMPADLFGTDQPSPIPPGVRSPYNLTDIQKQAGSESIARADREAGKNFNPWEQGQGDLFETPQQELARRGTTEGVTGARDKPAMDFIPQDREGNPAGVYPETQPRGVFQSQEDRVNTPPASVDFVDKSPLDHSAPEGPSDAMAVSRDPTRWGKNGTIYKDAQAIRDMDPEKRDNTETPDMPGGHAAFLLYEAQKTLPKPSDKLKRVTDHNSFALSHDYDYIANIDGEHYGISKFEDPDAVEGNEDEHGNAKEFVYAFQRIDSSQDKMIETQTANKDELFKQIRDQIATDKLSDIGPSDAQNKGMRSISSNHDELGWQTLNKPAQEMFEGLEKEGFGQIQTRDDGSRFIAAPLRKVLEHIGPKSNYHLVHNLVVSNFLRKLTARLAKLPNLSSTHLSFELDAHSTWAGEDVGGKYHAAHDTVAISRANWDHPLTILHEAVHAAFVHEQWVNPDSPFSKAIRALYTWSTKNLKEEAEKNQTLGMTGEQAVHEAANRDADGAPGYYNEHTYGFKNEREFLAEGMTTPGFMDLLDTMHLDKDQIKYLNDLLPDAPKPRSFLDAFKQFALNLFKRPFNEASMLDQLMRVTQHGFDTAGKVSKTETTAGIQKLMQAGKWDAQARAASEGPKGLIDSYRQFKSIADMPLKEVMDKFTPESIRDIGELFKGQAYAQIDRVNSILAEGIKGSGEMIKWGVDKLNTIDRVKDVNIENALKGDKYTTGAIRGFAKRLWGDDGALTVWRRLRATDEGMVEMRSMLTEWLHAQKEGRDPMFGTEKQRNVYDTVQKQFGKALDFVNEKREAAGMEKIKPLKSYFPSLVMGDYRVLVRDANGKTVHYSGYNNVYEAKQFVKLLKAEGIEGLDIKDPYHIQPDKYKLGDLSAFEESMRVLGSDDPAAQAIQKVYAEVSGKRGAGSHGIKKDFVHGFMGSQAGEVGVRSAEKAVEAYLKKMYTYGANLEKAGVRREIASLDPKLREKIPNTISYLNDYVEHSRGGDLKQWFAGVDAMTEFISKKMGMGESGARRNLNDMTALMGTFWLFTEKFAVTQIPQHLNAMAKMVQLAGRGDFSNPIAAYFGGIKNAIAPDAIALAAVDFARRNGYLNPVVAELVHTKLAQTSMSDSMRDLTRWSLGKIEQEIVRVPTFLMFEKGLRGTVSDPKARFQEAAELTGHYMTNYNQTSKPMVYNKLGATLGGTAAPLKTFSHNLYGQFFEYAKGIKDGEYAPLATFVGTQALVAGLKGTILVAEATAIITAINAVNEARGKGGNAIPTPEEWLLEAGTSDWLVYGATSKLTGQDMTMSVGASGLNQMLSLPVAEFQADMSMAAYNYITKSLTGTDTIADRMRLALALSPNALHGQVEDYFTEPGHPVPNPYDPQGRGNYVRTERDWFMAQAGMGRSISESKANALNKAAKEDLLYHEAVKGKMLDAIGDRVRNKQPIDNDLIQAYVKEGGNPKTLSADLIARQKQQSMDYITRQQQGKSMTPERARKLQIMQPAASARPGSYNPWEQ